MLIPALIMISSFYLSHLIVSRFRNKEPLLSRFNEDIHFDYKDVSETRHVDVVHVITSNDMNVNIIAISLLFKDCNCYDTFIILFF